MVEQHVVSTGERAGVELARALEDAARGLVERGADEDVEHTLQLIVRGAIHTIPHVEQAGISLVERGGSVTARAPSNDVVRELDELQTELGEGPCLDSIWYEQRTVIEDMTQVRRSVAPVGDRGAAARHRFLDGVPAVHRQGQRRRTEPVRLRVRGVR